MPDFVRIFHKRGSGFGLGGRGVGAEARDGGLGKPGPENLGDHRADPCTLNPATDNAVYLAWRSSIPLYVLPIVYEGGARNVL